MTDLMSIIEITRDGENLTHVAQTFEEEIFSDYVVSLQKLAVSENQEAFEKAQDWNIVDAAIDFDEAPEGVFMYRIEDPNLVEWAETYEDAYAKFVEFVEVYYEHEIGDLDENLSSDGYWYDGGSDYSYMVEGLDATERAAFSAEDFEAHAMQYLTQNRDFSNAVAGYIYSEFAKRYPKIIELIVNRCRATA